MTNDIPAVVHMRIVQLRRLGYMAEPVKMETGYGTREYAVLVSGGKLRAGAFAGLFSPIFYLYGICLIILPLLFQWLIPKANIPMLHVLITLGVIWLVTGVILDWWGRRS